MFKGLISFNITLLRIIRGVRVFRVFKSLKNLVQLIEILVKSAISFLYLLTISILLSFIYTLLGMTFFQGIDYSKCETINHEVNFDSFWNALMVLTAAETGDNWSAIMIDT